MRKFKVTICLILALVCLAAAIYMPNKQVANAANTPTQSTMECIEWKRVRTYADLPRESNKTYYMYVVWSSNCSNLDPNKLTETSSYAKISTGLRVGNNSNNIQAATFATSSFPKAFSVTAETFVTSSAYGMFQIEYVGTDDKNKCSSNDSTYNGKGCPKYKIRLNGGSGDYIIADDGHLSYTSSRSSGSNWCIAVQETNTDLENYEESAKYDGCTCVYFERSGYDRGWVVENNEIKSMNTSSDYDELKSFMMWIGTPATYTVITENYEIMPGEVFSIKDRVILKNDKTIKVWPGGVLCVDGTFINNGSIVNYGTLIVEEEGEIFPIAMGTSSLSDKNAIDSKSNYIVNYGPSAKVSPPGYKKTMYAEGIMINKGNVTFGTGMGNFYNKSGATVENSGMLLIGSMMYAFSSTINNTGMVIAHCKVNNPGSLHGYDHTDKPVYFIIPRMITLTQWEYVTYGPYFGIACFEFVDDYENIYMIGSTYTNSGNIWYSEEVSTTW